MEDSTETSSSDAQSNNDLSPEAALELVKPFFPQEWAKLDAKDVKVRKITGGYFNCVDVVTRSSAILSPTEPVSLLIKRKGGNVFDLQSIADAQPPALGHLIEYEMSKIGLGPKLYGLFPGGSISELVQGHTLAPEDIADEEICGEYAKALAGVHSIRGLPLRLDSIEKLWETFFDSIPQIGEKLNFISNHEAMEKIKLNMNFLKSFDFKSEIDWIKEKVESSRMRKTFIHMDMNFLNCLVRDQAEKGQSRIVLIDYDEARYHYRGGDIGMHFISRRNQYDNKEDKVIPGSTFPTLEERKKFLTVYQQEMKRIGAFDDFDEGGIDSIDNLLIESKLGACFTSLYFAIFMFANPESFIDLDPAFLSMAQFMLETYLEFKEGQMFD